MKVLTGDKKTMPPEWNTLFAMADAGLATAQAYQAIQQYVDVPAMIDYMLMIYYTGSRDAPVFLGDQCTPRNFYAIRPREPAGPFVFLPWDVEWALEDPGENRVEHRGGVEPPRPDGPAGGESRLQDAAGGPHPSALPQWRGLDAGGCYPAIHGQGRRDPWGHRGRVRALG